MKPQFAAAAGTPRRQSQTAAMIMRFAIASTRLNRDPANRGGDLKPGVAFAGAVVRIPSME
jgi:hypothetical protein